MSMRVFVGFQRFSLKYCSGERISSHSLAPICPHFRRKLEIENVCGTKKRCRAQRRSELGIPNRANPNEKEDHSYRSATVGSMPTARIAGMRQASKAMAARRIATDTKVSGSVGLT